MQKLEFASNQLLFFTAGSDTSTGTKNNTTIESDFQTPTEFSSLMVEVFYLKSLLITFSCWFCSRIMRSKYVHTCTCVHHVGCVLQALHDQQTFGSYQL